MAKQAENRPSEKGVPGFSLVEMSVVIVLIGLLAAGVMTGKSLVENARVQGVVSEFAQLRSAVDAFVDVQHYYPGDYPDASKAWENAADGNGDWRISASESAHVMYHLHAAGDVDRSYAGGGALLVGTNLAPSSFKPGGYWVRTHEAATPVHGKSGEAIDLAGPSSSAALEDGVLTPGQAYAVDVKTDDGMPAAGDLFASSGTKAGSPVCTEEAGDSVAYAAGEGERACRLHSWLARK
jgi:prepilin-type N-terminal cleavage/methylation domain-containing protein